MGERMWLGHYELDVPIADNQRDWTPLQREFLMRAADKYGPDPPKRNNL